MDWMDWVILIDGWLMIHPSFFQNPLDYQTHWSQEEREKEKEGKKERERKI